MVAGGVSTQKVYCVIQATAWGSGRLRRFAGGDKPHGGSLESQSANASLARLIEPEREPPGVGPLSVGLNVGVESAGPFAQIEAPTRSVSPTRTKVI